MPLKIYWSTCSKYLYLVASCLWLFWPWHLTKLSRSTFLIAVQVLAVFFLSFFLVFHLLLRLSFSLHSFLSRPVHLSADVIVPSAARGLGAPVSGLLSLAPSSSRSRPSVNSSVSLEESPDYCFPHCHVGKCSRSIAPQQSEDSTKKNTWLHVAPYRTTVRIISIIIIRIMSALFRRQTISDSADV